MDIQTNANKEAEELLLRSKKVLIEILVVS